MSAALNLRRARAHADRRLARKRRESWQFLTPNEMRLIMEAQSVQAAISQAQDVVVNSLRRFSAAREAVMAHHDVVLKDPEMKH